MKCLFLIHLKETAARYVIIVTCHKMCCKTTLVFQDITSTWSNDLKKQDSIDR